jgi:diguanylate cyclase (GGDEF)-like protein
MIIRNHQFKPIRRGGGITVSLGIACSPDKRIKDYDDLINVADNALFRAKEKGRDRIAV